MNQECVELCVCRFTSLFLLPQTTQLSGLTKTAAAVFSRAPRRAPFVSVEAVRAWLMGLSVLRVQELGQISWEAPILWQDVADGGEPEMVATNHRFRASSASVVGGVASVSWSVWTFQFSPSFTGAFPEKTYPKATSNPNQPGLPNHEVFKEDVPPVLAVFLFWEISRKKLR